MAEDINVLAAMGTQKEPHATALVAMSPPTRVYYVFPRVYFPDRRWGTSNVGFPRDATPQKNEGPSPKIVDGQGFPGALFFWRRWRSPARRDFGCWAEHICTLDIHHQHIR
jgi:hypothetical protein